MRATCRRHLRALHARPHRERPGQARSALVAAICGGVAVWLTAMRGRAAEDYAAAEGSQRVFCALRGVSRAPVRSCANALGS